MKVGDLVRYKKNGPTIARNVKNTGVIIEIDDSHRQTHVTLLLDNGRLVKNIWDASLEVVSKS